MIELRGEGLDFEQSTGWKREDKRAICKALLPVLQMTRNLNVRCRLNTTPREKSWSLHSTTDIQKEQMWRWTAERLRLKKF